MGEVGTYYRFKMMAGGIVSILEKFYQRGSARFKAGRGVFLVAAIGIMLVPAAGLVKAQIFPVFNLDNYPGQWTLVTNADKSVEARESTVHRQGDIAYARVLQLETMAVPVFETTYGAITKADVHRFIAKYRPPPIPYTSNREARKTGEKKYNCVDFAEDLVKQAKTNGIPAQVIGIEFEGKSVGHAVAGFPTADAGMLYFDSTPSNGEISHGAHEAHLKLGQSYTRSDRGELSGIGRLPVTAILPVTRLPQFPNGIPPRTTMTETTTEWGVANERRTLADGIEYADTNTFKVADEQLDHWKTVADNLLAEQKEIRDRESSITQGIAAKAAARALAENEEMAARNDPYGQLRMGERYLMGDGVPKNPAQGKIFLQMAADQGSPTAILDLQNINAQQMAGR